MTPDLLCPVSYIARRLAVAASTVRWWVRTGKLEAVRTPAGGYRVPRSELERILATRKTLIPPISSTHSSPTVTLRPHP